MPNRFEGQVQDNFDRKLKDVKVTLTGTDIPPGTFTKTDENGKWVIILKQSIESKDVTVSFTKSGMESKQVTNPQPTEVLNGFIDPEKGGTLDLKGLYESGTYLVSSLSNESKEVLNQELEDLFQFIKNHPGNTKITITSSESQVTNSDNETGDGINRTNEFRRTPGSLAKARAEALQKYVNTFLDTKYTENPNLDRSGRPTIEFGEIDRQGNEPWERFFTPDPKNPNNLIQTENPKVIADNDKALKEYNANPANVDNKISRTADLPKYKNDQYTRITVEVINKDCLSNNLVLDVMYIGEGHQCNSAIYQMEANGQLLLRDDGANYASLNNDLAKYLVDNKIASQGTGKWNLVKKFNNEVTGYNAYYTTTVIHEDPKRFKFLKKGDIFPINDLTPPVGGHFTGGHRYNRFIITSSKLKELTAGSDKKIVTFTMTCWRPEELGTKETKGYADYWGYYNCHKGVGAFKLYKVKVQNNTFIVDYASDTLNGVTPSNVNGTIELFKYDVCSDVITLNPDVFSAEAIRNAQPEGT
jgi:hypothetical protein